LATVSMQNYDEKNTASVRTVIDSSDNYTSQTDVPNEVPQ